MQFLPTVHVARPYIEEPVADLAMLECELGAGAGFVATSDCGSDIHGCQKWHSGGLPRQFGGRCGDSVDVEATGCEHLTNGAGGAGRAARGILRKLGKDQ